MSHGERVTAIPSLPLHGEPTVVIPGMMCGIGDTARLASLQQTCAQHGGDHAELGPSACLTLLAATLPITRRI